MLWLDIIAIPLILIAVFVIYRIWKITGNRGILVCFGAFFTIGVVRRLFDIYGHVTSVEVKIIDDSSLFINLGLQLIGFYLIWKDLEKLIGGKSNRL
jgi:hypothetical protein